MGCPAAKFVVPSMGSTTQSQPFRLSKLLSSSAVDVSSPRKEWLGKFSFTIKEITSSHSESTSVKRSAAKAFVLITLAPTCCLQPHLSNPICSEERLFITLHLQTTYTYMYLCTYILYLYTYMSSYIYICMSICLDSLLETLKALKALRCACSSPSGACGGPPPSPPAPPPAAPPAWPGAPSPPPPRPQRWPLATRWTEAAAEAALSSTCRSSQTESLSLLFYLYSLHSITFYIILLLMIISCNIIMICYFIVLLIF